MPKYTFEKDGQKYSVTSDTQPTREQLFALVEKQQPSIAQEQPSTPKSLQDQALSLGITPFGLSEDQIKESIEEQKRIDVISGEEPTTLSVDAPKKITEESLIKDPKWIDSSKTLYEWDWQRKNPSKPIPKLSKDGYAQFGLEYGSGLSFSDVDLVREGQAIGNATDEQKEAFVNIMDMYDAKAPSWSGAGRAAKNILNPLESPTTYVGLGAGKVASTAAKQVAKNQIKNNLLKSIVTSKPGRYAVIGSAEGAAFGGAYETARQRARIRSEAQQEYKPGDIAKGAGVGTVFGGALGGTLGVISNAITRRKQKTDPLALPAPEREVAILNEATPQKVFGLDEYNQELLNELIRLGLDPAKLDPWGLIPKNVKNPKKTAKKIYNDLSKKENFERYKFTQPELQPTPPTQALARTVEGEVVESPIAQKVKEIVSPVKPLNVVVDEDFGIVGKIPYIGNVYKKLGNSVLNKIKAKSVRATPLKDLPDQPQYLGTRGLFLGKLEAVRDLTQNVFKSFNKLLPEDNKPVYEFLLGERLLDDVPQNLKDDALDLRKGINAVSEVLEENGMLSKEIMEENYDTYLPRMFLKYFNKRSSPMGYLKKRKDLDLATREFLGEIEDVGLLGAKAIEEPLSDVVKLGFFKEVAKNPNWALQDTLVPFRGKKIGVFHAKDELNRIQDEIVNGLRTDKNGKDTAIVKDLKEAIDQAESQLAKADPKKWVQLPNDKKYGDLKGAYIRREVYDDIRGSYQEAEEIGNQIVKFGREATKVWKTLKVPLNPPSVVRNFVSNLVLLNLSGVSLTRMPLRMVEALKEIITNGKYYKIAQEKGIASSTFSRQEMVQINRLYQIVKSQQKIKQNNWLDIAHGKRMGSWLLNFAGDSYGFIETFGKLIKIIDDMKAGKNPETAVYNAQKTLFDYSLVPPTVRKVRQSPFGASFITFQYKVLPFLLDTFIRHPERYLKYFAVPAIAAEAWKRANKDMTNEDIDNLRETLPNYLRDGGNALVLPYKDDEGRWQFYDYSYMMPWGFYTGVGNKIAAGEYGEASDDVVGLLSGPGLNIAAAITTNKDPFTNREIVDTGAPPVDQLEDSLNYAWRVAAPTWLTDIGFAGKMYEAITKEPNYYGDPTITKPQAWYRLVGQNVYPVDPEQSRNTNLYFKRKDIEDAQNYYRKQIRQAQLRGDEEEEARLEQEAIQRINLLGDELAEYEAASKIPERLKRKKVEKE